MIVDGDNKATEPKRPVVGPEGTTRGDASRRSKVLWALWMTVGGVACAVIVYMITGSVPWTIIALLGSGVVLNAVGQAVTQPLAGMRGGRRRPPASHHRR